MHVPTRRIIRTTCSACCVLPNYDVPARATHCSSIVLRFAAAGTKSPCTLLPQTVGRGRHLADFAHNGKEISRGSTPHTCKYSLGARSLTYLPSICPPPVHTLAGCGCLLIARACHCLRPPVFISARINHAY